MFTDAASILGGKQWAIEYSKDRVGEIRRGVARRHLSPNGSFTEVYNRVRASGMVTRFL